VQEIVSLIEQLFDLADFVLSSTHMHGISKNIYTGLFPAFKSKGTQSYFLRAIKKAITWGNKVFL